ncbi:hypothetical protein NTH40_004929 [Vibrio harveyi]|nr:hypothetical protein [Vibrio harveyi]
MSLQRYRSRRCKKNKNSGRYLSIVSIVIASASAFFAGSTFVYPNFITDRDLVGSVVQIETKENGRVLVDIAYINDGNVDEVILGQKLVFTDDYKSYFHSSLGKNDKLEPIVLKPGEAKVIRFKEEFHKDFLEDFKNKERTEKASYPYIRAGVEISLIDRSGVGYKVKYMGALASRLDDYAVVSNFGAFSVDGSSFSLNEASVIK